MSIISISGKKTVGKDTVGKIIQYLTSESNIYPFDLKLDYSYKSNWQIKKFADKLKDIICLLINCTREQLEDESFKNSELGEEWWYYKVYESKVKGFVLYPYLENKDQYHIVALVKPTPRFLLQFIGTDLLRNQLHPEIWVNSLMSEYKSKLSSNYPVDDLDWEPRLIYPSWCITDLRFPNELEAVKKRGGITIRVNRPCNICGGSGYHKMSCPVSKSGEHYSETALDKSEFDYVIENSGSIEELIEKVKQILIKEKLL